MACTMRQRKNQCQAKRKNGLTESQKQSQNQWQQLHETKSSFMLMRTSSFLSTTLQENGALSEGIFKDGNLPLQRKAWQQRKRSFQSG
jgi:hypothetical protein